LVREPGYYTTTNYTTEEFDTHERLREARCMWLKKQAIELGYLGPNQDLEYQDTGNSTSEGYSEWKLNVI
jgi:hypothetical protein